VSASDLKLEITESTALGDISHVAKVIEECHALGVSFAIDDFGTGYSSLTYLRRLPAEMLKIDQSFVRDMLDDADDMAIVQGVVGLSLAFKRRVIAEGVESVEHGLSLIRLGCDLGQGYGIARPMPAEDVQAWVQAYKPDPSWFNVIPDNK
jgi:EAL domain-containing protein (putative c-di-GMP-specific phosphodiesterase class I)